MNLIKNEMHLSKCQKCIFQSFDLQYDGGQLYTEACKDRFGVSRRPIGPLWPREKG